MLFAIVADGIATLVCLWKMKTKIISTIIIIKNNIPHTPSKSGVLVSIIFSHTPDEAMSDGLAKACVPKNNLFCYREIELPY